jgi:hypothetical protein
MSENTWSKLLANLGLGGQMIAHGMRAAFRRWAAEAAEADHAVADLCLGHTVGGKSEEAYKRSDLLRRRAALMEKWSAFLTGQDAKVVPLKRAKRA